LSAASTCAFASSTFWAPVFSSITASCSRNVALFGSSWISARSRSVACVPCCCVTASITWLKRSIDAAFSCGSASVVQSSGAGVSAPPVA